MSNGTTYVGRISEIVRYPVKSMAGVSTASAYLGWHGLGGDRRFALRRVGDPGAFPFLTASRLPDLLRFRPDGLDEQAAEPQPAHVHTPEGERLALRSPELAADVARRAGSGVELLSFRNGIFDEGTVSLIAHATIAGIGAEAGLPLDPRRFRANIFLETEGQRPFLEDEWVGQALVFGSDAGGPAVHVTLRDERCMMINLDPETAAQDPRVMKTVVRLNGNMAGVYATVIRTGTLRVGDRVSVTPFADHGIRREGP
jgi:uncharacterized protein YcbX